jgi:putative flavoprotein involved in K+ transport
MTRSSKGGIEMKRATDTEQVGTVVIGGGQAGLAVGYWLARQGRSFLILDANERVGDAWRKRWDSLRLFSPSQFSGLPGLPIDAPAWSYPTKDELADYLERYADHFQLPVRTGVRVDELTKRDGRFVISAKQGRIEAEDVVVATGAHHVPSVPAFASQLDPTIVQLHSSRYRNASQLQAGDALVVGTGNSGAEIALELSRTRRVLLAGRKPNEIPVRHGTRAGRLGFRGFRFLGHNVLRVDTPIGRKVGPKAIAKGAPLIRTKLKDLAEAGVERLPRVVGVRDGLPVLEDDRVLEVANVVWCTGFRTDFDWIRLPAFDVDGEPKHYRGVVEAVPGLYFMGLVFLYAFSSDVLPGVGRDAEYIAKHIASTRRTEQVEEEAELLVA